jgi:hypothetical protein
MGFFAQAGRMVTHFRGGGLALFVLSRLQQLEFSVALPLWGKSEIIADLRSQDVAGGALGQAGIPEVSCRRS